MSAGEGVKRGVSSYDLLLLLLDFWAESFRTARSSGSRVSEESERRSGKAVVCEQVPLKDELSWLLQLLMCVHSFLYR